jgi:1,2-diacylglycerol 3-beta-glucosyltransferase
MSGPRHSPWTLVMIGGTALVFVAVLGAGRASALTATLLAVVFFVFLVRHMAFAASALWTAPFDMRTRTGFDFGFRPVVSVLVPCRNEELVIEGLVTCLLALEYPHELDSPVSTALPGRREASRARSTSRSPTPEAT